MFGDILKPVLVVGFDGRPRKAWLIAKWKTDCLVETVVGKRVWVPKEMLQEVKEASDGH